MTAFYQSTCEYGAGLTLEATLGGRPIRETILMQPRGGAELVLITYLDGEHALAGAVVNAFNTVDIAAFEARVLAAGGSVVEEIRPIEFNGKRMRMGIYADPEGFMLEVLER
ncbi:MAG: hypothetical protein RLZZ136_904 [Pseudomonadota bacterium]